MIKSCIDYICEHDLFLHSQKGKLLKEPGKDTLGHTVLYGLKVCLETLNIYADGPNSSGTMVYKITSCVAPCFDHMLKANGRIIRSVEKFDIFSSMADVMGFVGSVSYFFDGGFVDHLKERRFAAVVRGLISVPAYASCVAEFGKDIGLWSLTSLENLTKGFGQIHIFGFVGKAAPLLEGRIPFLASAAAYIGNIKFLNNEKGLDNWISLSLITIYLLSARDAQSRYSKLRAESQLKVLSAKEKFDYQQAKLDFYAASSEIFMRVIPALGYTHPMVKGFLGAIAIICTGRGAYHKHFEAPPIAPPEAPKVPVA